MMTLMPTDLHLLGPSPLNLQPSFFFFFFLFFYFVYARTKVLRF